MSLKSATAALISALVLVTACNDNRALEPAKNTDRLPLAAQWSQSATHAKDVTGNWISSFDDQQLNTLVSEALEHNADLKIAIANLQEARANAKASGAQLKPTVDLALGGGRSGNELASTNSADAGLQFQWELDLWGRLSDQAQAATLSAQAAEADLRAARQSLAAAVAEAYFLANTSKQLVALSQRIKASYKKSIDVVSVQAKAGTAKPMDLELAKADYQQAQANLAQDELALRDALRALEFLLGRYPKAEDELPSTLPQVPAAPSTGLPSELLERRPDIVAADRRVAAAFKSSNAARAARLPRFSFSATLAGSGQNLSDALNPSNSIWNLGANLLTPLIDAGRIDAQIEVKDAQQQKVLAAYVKVALNALKEVEQSIDKEKTLAKRLGFITSSTNELIKAGNIAQKQYESGLTNILSLNQVLRQQYQSEKSLVALKGEQLRERIRLHLALGGDFD